MQYKTKAVRKAARWARRGKLTGIVKKFRQHLWFRELVHTYGTVHACRMTADALKAPSFAGHHSVGHSSVVVWTETNYGNDWMHTRSI